MGHDDIEPLDWDREEYFRRAAARRNLTPEQLRAQLRTISDESRQLASHVPFEHLRDGELSEDELSHLDRCQYCSRFLQTVNPNAEEVERFVGKALSRLEPAVTLSRARTIYSPRQAVAPRWWFPGALAAGVLLGAIGLFTFQTTQRPSLAVKNVQPWQAAVERCQAASGEIKGCELFADAARYQLIGDTKTAQQLLTRGLERTGVSAPVVAQVQKTLDSTPASPAHLEVAKAQAQAAAAAIEVSKADASDWLASAQLHVIAGQRPQAYSALAKYLKDTTPHAQSTAYIVGFEQTLNQIGAYKVIAENPERLRPSAAAKSAASSSSAP
jgi:hypothetical protein